MVTSSPPQTSLTFLFHFLIFLNDEPLIFPLPRVFSLFGRFREPGVWVKVIRVYKKSKSAILHTALT